jgi:F-type H+-transporting ATPase subunit delta
MPNLAESYGTALHGLLQGMGDKEAESALEKFVTLLKNRNQLYLAPKAIAAYEREARKAEGIERVRFTSAEKISDTERRRITKELAASIGRPLEIEWTDDPSLIAGAVIRYADLLIDASVKGRLARLKQQIA